MLNYEWQKHIKTKYLDLAHAMQVNANTNPLDPNFFDKKVIINDIRMANELIKTCQEYIAEQLRKLEI